MNSTGKIDMDKVMQASLGEVSNKLEVTFKKTVLIRDYETEVIEATTTVELEHSVTALLQVQMEYTAYCNLAAKGIVTGIQLSERKKTLEEGLYAIKYKADQILGEGIIDKYLDCNNLK